MLQATFLRRRSNLSSRDPSSLRKSIPILERVTYLDSAATTPKPMEVIRAVEEFTRDVPTFGAGEHELARRALDVVEEVRDKLRDFLDAHEHEIIFTKNCSEALSQAILGLRLEDGDRVLVSNLEHHSCLVPALFLRNRGIDVEIIWSNQQGLIDPDSLNELIDRRTKLVIVCAVSNALGSIQDLEELSKVARDSGAIFMTDAAQAAGFLPISIEEMGIDILASSGHKGLLGPLGTGFLCISRELLDLLDPIIPGCPGTDVSIDLSLIKRSDPIAFESGAPNVPGIYGLGVAIDILSSIGIERIAEWNRRLVRFALRRLAEIDGVRILGPEDEDRRAQIIPFVLDGISPIEIARRMARENIMIQAGHLCAKLALRAAGIEEVARISLHAYNNEEDLEKFLEVMEAISLGT